MGLCISAASAQVPAGEHPHDAPPADESEESRQKFPNLKFIGFTDLNFFATDQKGVVNSGFSEGQFTLHLYSPLSERVSFVAEVTVTALSQAATSSDPHGYRTEIERTILKYDFSDRAKLSLGRYHTPINYWNTAYHHGQWLQTSISRPEMTRFGGDFIPVHFVGVLLEGSVPAGGLHLNYNAGVGNGRSSTISRGGDAGDVNNNRAWLINAFIKPDALYGLQTGLSLYRDTDTLRGTNYEEWIQSAHVVWTHESPEVIAEAARISHRNPIAGTSYDNNAYYVQLAYRLPARWRRFKPYARYEHMSIDEADPVFTSLRDRKIALGGVRYDFIDLAAVKLEYRRTQTRTQSAVQGVFAQVCFTF